MRATGPLRPGPTSWVHTQLGTPSACALLSSDSQRESEEDARTASSRHEGIALGKVCRERGRRYGRMWPQVTSKPGVIPESCSAELSSLMWGAHQSFPGCVPPQEHGLGVS